MLQNSRCSCLLWNWHAHRASALQSLNADCCLPEVQRIGKLSTFCFKSLSIAHIVSCRV